MGPFSTFHAVRKKYATWNEGISVMWSFRAFRGVIACLAVSLTAQAAQAQSSGAMQPTNRAVVSIGITVGPVAEIVFPEGQAFELRVPDALPDGNFQAAQQLDALYEAETEVPMAEIPFVVRGNATAVVEAQPGETTWANEREFGVARAVGPDGTGSRLAYSMELAFGTMPSDAFPAIVSANRSGRSATSGVVSMTSVAQSPEHGSLRIVGDRAVLDTGSGRFHGEIIVAVSAEL